MDLAVQQDLTHPWSAIFTIDPSLVSSIITGCSRTNAGDFMAINSRKRDIIGLSQIGVQQVQKRLEQVKNCTRSPCDGTVWFIGLEKRQMGSRGPETYWENEKLRRLFVLNNQSEMIINYARRDVYLPKKLASESAKCLLSRREKWVS